jgi:hypothetical protein
MTKILMNDGREYETEAELSHLLDRVEVELPAPGNQNDERGYEVGDDGLAPARGILWAFGLELLAATAVAWIVR